jgi:hypothetical protein
MKHLNVPSGRGGALALGITLTLALVGGTAWTALAQQDLPTVAVYKSPTCGCCSKWIEHMQAAGFQVKSQDLEDVDQVKSTYGVPAALGSCHTALVGGYVVEGHVPADAVKRLLKEKPRAAGIAVPGMPIGSPGMEMGSRKDPYAIMLFDRDGKYEIFEKR